MSEDKSPLVSCLCVTNNRVSFLKRSVDCFLHQSYLNKELVIVCEESDNVTTEYVKSLSYDNIRAVTFPENPKLTLGEQRNLSIHACDGEYFCQWDDDDWYHNQRLEIQMEEALKNGKDASILVYKLMFDAVNSNGFLSNVGPWPNTILCKKSIIKDQLFYPKLNKKEDEAFVMSLYGEKCIYPIIKPTLYIYVYHGNNTWDLKHFNMLFAKSQPLSKSITETVSAVLTNAISNSDASKILLSNEFLKELNYFHQ
jgi:glycosyltransferase involved in cell wall biosynthesis